MKHEEFNPEKKYQEWQNRPAKKKLLRKRRISIFLLLLNISIIFIAYMIFNKTSGQLRYYSSKAEFDDIEYRVSATDNIETMSYSITLTIVNKAGVKKMIVPGKDISSMYINYNNETIETLDLAGIKDAIEVIDKALVFNYKLNKATIDNYLAIKGLIQKKKNSFFKQKKEVYSIEGLILIGVDKKPFIIKINHEASE